MAWRNVLTFELPSNHSIKRNRGENPKELTLETGHYLSPGRGEDLKLNKEKFSSSPL